MSKFLSTPLKVHLRNMSLSLFLSWGILLIVSLFLFIFDFSEVNESVFLIPSHLYIALSSLMMGVFITTRDKIILYDSILIQILIILIFSIFLYDYKYYNLNILPYHENRLFYFLYQVIFLWFSFKVGDFIAYINKKYE